MLAWMNIKGGRVMKKFVVLAGLVLLNSVILASQFTIYSVTPTASISGTEIATKDFSIQFSFPIDYTEMVSAIKFTFINFTNNPISIMWDSSAYVDPSNNSHRIMHLGVKYISRYQPIPPTIVAPMARISDAIFPVDNVEFVSGTWSQRQLFYPEPGTTFGVLLAVKINDKIQNFIVRFAVEGAQAESASTLTSKSASQLPSNSASPLRSIREGLGLLVYGHAIYGDKGQITGYQGVNWLLGYTTQYYFNKSGMQPNQFNTFWQWGTIALLAPYIGVGGDYVIPNSQTSDLVLTIGTIYIYPYIGLSFDF